MKKRVRPLYIILFILAVCVSLCIVKGHRSAQYYKQYGNPEVKKDDLSKRVHTPYLSLPKGDYEFIVGYSSDSDLSVRVGNEDFVLKASNEGSEGFQAFNVSLFEPADDFCLSWDENTEVTPEIYEYELKTTKPYNSDAVYLGLLFFILAAGLLLAGYFGVISKLSREDVLVLLLLVSAIVFSDLPLFRGYLVYGHDLMGHLKRIEGLKTAIYQGHLFPLVYPGVNNGYGEAAICYPYFFLYIPALLRLVNISMPFAYNTLLFLINLGTGIFSYLAFKALTKDKTAAAAGAFLYLLFPYRLSDLYIRASLGESIAMTFLPVILWGIYEVIEGDKKRYYILSLGFCGLIFSHVLSIGLAGLFVLFLTLVFIKKLISEKRIMPLFKAALICLVFALPEAMFLKGFSPYINLGDISVADFHRYSLYPAQLFMNDASFYTLLDLKEGIGQEMTQGIGILGGMISLLILLRLFRRPKKDLFMTVSGAFALIFIFASTTLCPWDYLEKLPVFSTITGMIQFPLRFLSVVSLILSAEAAVFIKEIKEINDGESKLFIPSHVPPVIFIMTVIFSASVLTDTVLRQNVLITDIDGGLLRTPYTEYIPAETPEELFSDTKPHSDNAVLSEYEKHGNFVSFKYEKEEDGASVVLPLLYYPGYHAKGSDGKLNVRRGNDNRVEVVLPEGSREGNVKLDNSVMGYFNF